ncbi:hypothetical protein MBLNU230_g6104t1 [Neophaeotheca triangularis]
MATEVSPRLFSRNTDNTLVLVRKPRRTRNRGENQTAFHDHASALFRKVSFASGAEGSAVQTMIQRVVHRGHPSPTFALSGSKAYVIFHQEDSRTARPEVFIDGPCLYDSDYEDGVGYSLEHVTQEEGVEVFDNPSGDLIRETLFNGSCHYEACRDGYIECDARFAQSVTWMLRNLRPLKLKYIQRLEQRRGPLFRSSGQTLCPHCMGLGLTIKHEKMVSGGTVGSTILRRGPWQQPVDSPIPQTLYHTEEGFEEYVETVQSRRQQLGYTDQDSAVIVSGLVHDARSFENAPRQATLFDASPRTTQRRSSRATDVTPERNNGSAAIWRGRSRPAGAQTTSGADSGSPARGTVETFNTSQTNTPSEVTSALGAMDPHTTAGALDIPERNNLSRRLVTRRELLAAAQYRTLIENTMPEQQIRPRFPGLPTVLDATFSEIPPNARGLRRRPRTRRAPEEASASQPLARPGSILRPYSWFANARDRVLESTCTICMEEYKEGEEVIELQCGHFFHAECLALWREYSCPMCRHEAGPDIEEVLH